MQSTWHRLESLSLKITPAALTTLAVFLAAVPTHIPGLSQIMPVLALICIYFWNTFWPGALPFSFIAALGLLQDTLSGTPMGLSSSIDILMGLLLLRERRIFGKAQFGVVWLGFILLSLACLTGEWLVMDIYLGRILPVRLHLLQWVATCLTYPPLHALFSKTYRALAES